MQSSAVYTNPQKTARESLVVEETTYDKSTNTIYCICCCADARDLRVDTKRERDGGGGEKCHLPGVDMLYEMENGYAAND